ncbi:MULTISPECIES: hypothetical protein [Xanthomonas]|uniref:Uncharacterized protein n=1 Tax=Xanthomonas phaseoli pv. dieffenbachiae TaxID=92828 RepID=A0A1V9H214_9XANT|nr:hypothetical protein [Xanthomonas phaseoli]MBO9768968.1 hypothetical protein [Xanthomonas phaseoli pv. dieffenbachiae]MBO9774356.1 hypothetical protein [Xanthomonas phaseoli pv. dieffenbachiae]MBO9780447.1 hypothetical protein [Xanthomonas phaseoli pv. dieffenbachiae]MBO9789576.1 hypothetical protein [Xanthomonas phaseoli pv. dieffenbachiae]MBO9795764.1 hypothetical protein [Xanthomonas phaseoli pv. dieffenbachiae]
MTMPVRARWRASPRLLRWPLSALIALYVSYLLLGNLLLNTPLGPAALNRSPDKFTMQWGPALTWWPGRVVLWDVDLQGHSERTNWSVGAQRMSGQIRLLPLLHRQLLVPELHARGVRGGLQAALATPGTVAMRAPAAMQAPRAAVAAAKGIAETPAASANAGTSTATPNVEHTATPPPAQSLRITATTNATSATPTNRTPESAKRADAQARTPRSSTAWTLQFDRIVAEQVQAVSLRQLHIEGQGQLQLGLFKQLRGGPMELFPSRAVFESARVRWGQDEVMRNGQLRIEASIARHAPDQAGASAVLQLTDALIAVHGDTAALDITRHAQGRHTLATRAGKGRADGELRWIRGALQPGSQLQWRAPLHDSTRVPAALLGELTAQLQVDQNLRLKVSMPEPADAGLTLDADIRVQGRQLPVHSMRSLLPRTSGHARLHWQLSSLSWIAALFPDVDWLTLEGEGLVDADLRIDRGQLAAGSRLQVPHVQAQVGVMGHAITGQASADLRVDADASGQLLPALALQMQQFSIAQTDAPTRPFVQGRDLRLDLRTRADAHNLSSLRDATRAHLVFANARVPDLRAYNRYLPQQQLRFDGGSGVLSGDLQIEPGGRIGKGGVRIAARAARLQFAGLALRGDVDADLRLQRGDLRAEQFSLDASSIQLRNVGFTGPDGQNRDGWWARIVLDDARMQWRQPVGVDGRVRIQVRDLAFLVALYARDRSIPNWMLRLVDAGQAQLTARAHWQGETVIVDRLQARNERFQVDARLRLQGTQRSGSLLARWGLLSAAVGLRGDTPEWHLRGAPEWYRAQPDLLR